MEIALAIIICLDSIICFIIGAVIGQKVSRQEKIELNPVKVVNKAIEEHKEALIKDAEDEYYRTVMRNIDNYTGDSIGQVDIPRRK